MVKFQLEALNKAIDESQYKPAQIAALADVAPNTLDKVRSGEPNILLESLVRVAEQLGLDVVVAVKKRRRAAVEASA